MLPFSQMRSMPQSGAGNDGSVQPNVQNTHIPTCDVHTIKRPC